MIKLLPFIVLSTTLSLAGCDNLSMYFAKKQGPRAVALPLIQEAIAEKVPTFDGRWNAGIMGQVCRLASGEINKQVFDSWFSQHRVDVNVLAESDSGFNFVAHTDENHAKVACAAWLVSSQLAPLQAWGREADDSDKLNSKLAPMTPLVGQTIELLAQLAASTTDRDYPSEATYRQTITKAFSNAAPAWITSTFNGKFVLKDYLRPGSNNCRFVYRLSNGQTEVNFNGVTWLGGGKIKGEIYLVNLNKSPTQP